MTKLFNLADLGVVASNQQNKPADQVKTQSQKSPVSAEQAPAQKKVGPNSADPETLPRRISLTSASLNSRPPSTSLTLAPQTGGSASFSLQEMQSILLELGVKPAHVQIALRRTEQTGEPLAQVMRDFGFLSGEGVALAVSKQTRLDYFSAEAVDHIRREDFAGVRLQEFKKFVPVGRDLSGALLVAVPDSSEINQAVNAFFGHNARPVIASEHTIQTVYRKYFANTEQAFDKLLEDFNSIARQSKRRDEEDDKALGLVRDLYFSMLRHACYSGASDLYLHRSAHVGIVRLKVNGVGQIFRTMSLALYDRILNKMVQDNVKADDLRMKPKESIIEFSEDDKKQHSDLAGRFNFRLELTESRGVRSAVIRILDRNAAATDLDKLGFDTETFAAINRISKTATGFFLVTGPTGSGKTTSLYAILKSIDAVERSVQSIENPIEYDHGLWLQFEPRKDSTDEGESLNEWLKALLRNAPDVILVGEVRDRNVANICLNAANTGHLVFATLHTNDAVMAMARLKSLQIDLDVLGSVLLGVLAQRLLRLLCSACRVPDEREKTLAELDEPYLAHVLKKPYRAGNGCPDCDYTGFRGRRMVYELLEMNPAVRQALETGQAPSVLAKHGMPEGRTMWANGLKLVSQGLTSLDELHRVASKNMG